MEGRKQDSVAAGSQARLVERPSKRKRCGVEMGAHSTNSEDDMG